MSGEKRKRDMWKNIPWNVRAKIVESLHAMPECAEKQICLLAFEDGKSTTEIATWCKDNDICSRNHRPYSRRRIQQIIAQTVPEYNAYQVKDRYAYRKDHSQKAWKTEKTECKQCGSKERLELHHMIPAFLGGTADDRNYICLCHNCHMQVTAYQRELFPEHFGRR